MLGNFMLFYKVFLENNKLHIAQEVDVSPYVRIIIEKILHSLLA